MSRTNLSRWQLLLHTAIWVLASTPVLADNCGSLSDCWDGARAAAVAAVAVALTAASNLFAQTVWSDYWKSLRNRLGPVFSPGSAYSEAMDDVRELADAVATTGRTVFQDIADDVSSGLATGVLPPQTDGGLGQVRDNFTPDGDVPFDVGEIPGIGSRGGGFSREGADVASGSPTPAGEGTPTPLGGADTYSDADRGHSAPTDDDLGIDPDSGETTVYYPKWGVVDVYNSDGTWIKTIAWPPITDAG